MKIGVDIGGSHIAIGIVTEEGKIVAKQEEYIKFIEQEKTQIRQQIRDTIVSLINSTLKQMQMPVFLIDEIGIGIPGVVEQNKIKKCDKFEIINWDLAKELEDYYDTTVKIQNDAFCAAMAESIYGNLRNAKNAVFMCLGTGIGGTIILNNQIIPSELGHMIIEKEGEKCNCQNRGCLENYCSMRTLKNDIKKILEIEKNISSEEMNIILNNEKQNRELQNIEEEFTLNLAIGINNIINILNPSKICIGGSFVHFEKTLYHMLIAKMNTLTYKFNKPEIILSKLGNDAGIIGATLI